MCPIAALLFYLFAQFNRTGEGEQFYFLDNLKWFKLKLLVDCRGKVKTNQGISNLGYFKKMKDACAKLKICSQHFVHFGRCAGLVKAELEELEGYDIDDLGNWNVNVCQNVYSAKLPMKAMRVVGGHPKEKEV